MAGIPVSDYPFDKNRKLGIDHKKVFIHFGTDVATVYFDSIAPTQSGTTEWTNIVMIGDKE